MSSQCQWEVRSLLQKRLELTETSSLCSWICLQAFVRTYTEQFLSSSLHSVKQFIIERVVQPSNSQILSSIWLSFHGARPSPLLYELAPLRPRTTSYSGQSQWQHLALSICHAIERNTADYYTNLDLTQTIRLKPKHPQSPHVNYLASIHHPNLTSLHISLYPSSSSHLLTNHIQFYIIKKS